MHGLWDNCPLEVMAYDHEARFKSNAEPYAVEAEMREQLESLPPVICACGWETAA